MFVSELTTLEFSGVETTLELSLRSGDKDLFTNTYYATPDGKVTIYALDQLLETYISDIYIDISIFANGVGFGPATISVFACSASVAERAQTFVTDFFLTSMMGERNTFMGRYEILTAFCPEEEEVKAICTYRLPDGSVETIEQSMTSLNGWANLNASSDQFYRADAQLVGYVVACGKRKQRYRVLAYAPEADPVFIFRNSFRAWETLYFTGLKEVQPSYTRSHATIAGRFVNYRIEEEMVYKANTGPLRQGMEMVAFDLARSKDVFLLDADGNASDEITITDCDLKFNNEDKQIPDLSFTYRLSDRRNARIAVVRPPKIFDKTFDETYE